MTLSWQRRDVYLLYTLSCLMPDHWHFLPSRLGFVLQSVVKQLTKAVWLREGAPALDPRAWILIPGFSLDFMCDNEQIVLSPKHLLPQL